jgi:hypothetical protein
MWTVRNRILHSKETREQLTTQHEALNKIIVQIFAVKPHPRLMAHYDNIYFVKHEIKTIKGMKLHRKYDWVEGAQHILTKYDRITTEQAAKFRSYFQWNRG